LRSPSSFSRAIASGQLKSTGNHFVAALLEGVIGGIEPLDEEAQVLRFFFPFLL
jgi:hypothetical protein